MAVLHEILAVEESKKGAANKVSGEAVNQFKNKADRYEGLIRNYEPIDEDGETFPREEKALGDRVKNKLDFISEIITDYLDVSMTKEVTNQRASADLTINGETILQGIPATGFLLLEKRFKTLREIFNCIPTLDPAENWAWNAEQDCWMSDDTKISKTKKTIKTHIVFEPTDHQKGQYEVYNEDVTVGWWTKRRFSGKLSVKQKADLIARLDKLIHALSQARMRANIQEAIDTKVGNTIFKWLMEPLEDKA